MAMAIKNVKNVQLNTKIMSAFLNTETLKTTFWSKSVHVVTRITKKKVWWRLEEVIS